MFNSDDVKITIIVGLTIIGIVLSISIPVLIHDCKKIELEKYRIQIETYGEVKN